jgi:superfamily I DNA/RNA helicase
MEYNIRQQNIINAKDKNILCLACAAGGKTATLIGRVKRLLDEGVQPSSMVAFTFTNQAAEEMRKRLGEKAQDMFIGTIHSYANKLCLSNGIDTTEYIANEQFDTLLQKAAQLPIAKLPQIEYLFVDEFQDTDPIQYTLITRLPVKNRFYVGDERQFIYSFRGASDQFIRELATDDNFTKYYLVENYRNPPNIIRFADEFLNSMPKISPSSVATITKSGFLDNECTFYDAAEEMTWTNDWTGWAVICRTNSEVEAVEEYLNGKNDKNIIIPNVIVKRGDLDLKAMGHLLEQNKVKIMTVHSAKGLEFPYVVSIGCKTFNQEERRICYVAATRAMKSLYWCPTIRTYKGKAKGKSHKAGNVFAKASQKTITF